MPNRRWRGSDLSPERPRYAAGGASGIRRFRPLWSLRPVPMHSRQTTHLASWPGSAAADGVQPAPAHVGHRSASAM
jgi:hypothetical protein